MNIPPEGGKKDKNLKIRNGCFLALAAAVFILMSSGVYADTLGSPAPAKIAASKKDVADLQRKYNHLLYRVNHRGRGHHGPSRGEFETFRAVLRDHRKTLHDFGVKFRALGDIEDLLQRIDDLEDQTTKLESRLGTVESEVKDHGKRLSALEGKNPTPNASKPIVSGGFAMPDLTIPGNVLNWIAIIVLLSLVAAVWYGVLRRRTPAPAPTPHIATRDQVVSEPDDESDGAFDHHLHQVGIYGRGRKPANANLSYDAYNRKFKNGRSYGYSYTSDVTPTPDRRDSGAIGS